jgi:hypothetical protein
MLVAIQSFTFSRSCPAHQIRHVSADKDCRATACCIDCIARLAEFSDDVRDEVRSKEGIPLLIEHLKAGPTHPITSKAAGALWCAVFLGDACAHGDNHLIPSVPFNSATPRPLRTCQVSGAKRHEQGRAA